MARNSGGTRLAKNDKLLAKTERKKKVDKVELLARKDEAMRKVCNR
jgi:hypothetical protein